MPGQRVRWDYDDLGKIAQLFGTEADRTRSTMNTLKRQMEVLQGGDWVGEGAKAFYAEMDGIVLPAFSRLVNAFNAGAQTTQQIGALARDTEDEATRLLNRIRAMADMLGRLDPGLGAALGALFAAAAMAQRQAALSNPSTAFDTIGTSGVSLSEAPSSIKIPSTLSSGMQDAWKDSFPGGHSHEQGGLLVRKADGTYEWRRGKSSAGTSGSFQPDYNDVKPGETLVAVGHTHPYDKSEGSHTDVPFSGQDMARLVYVPDPISYVQSGNGQFALVRTREFDDMVGKMSDAEKTTLFNNMKSDWNSTFKTAKGSFTERSGAAVQAVASKYHLLYYHGTGDTVNR